MTEIKGLYKEDLEVIYPYMMEDFPDNERKSRKMLEDMYDAGQMEGYGLYDGNTLLAYALFVCFENMRVFDYLAVNKEYRDRGIGTEFLKKLAEVMKDQEAVLGEVENPDYCDDPDEIETMHRRLDFYARNGFHDTGATGNVYFVEYRFLEMPVGRKHSKEETYELMGKYYHMYWKSEEEYNKHIQMHN